MTPRITPVSTRGAPDRQEEVVAEVHASGDDVTPSPALALAATVADLAQVLERAAPYADRAVTLDDLLGRAQALADSDVAGADDLVTLIEQAIAVE